MQPSCSRRNPTIFFQRSQETQTRQRQISINGYLTLGKQNKGAVWEIKTAQERAVFRTVRLYLKMH
jgi:hypothetical protein